jgi:acyl carrier protein
MTDAEKVVVEILQHHMGIAPGRIRSDTKINSDLGVDGDDAAELLTKIEKAFKIDTSDFEFPRYFGPESVSLLTIFSNLVRGRVLKFEPLSVKSLAEYVDKKKL